MEAKSALSMAASIDQWLKENFDYYNQWMFDEPIVITAAEDRELAELQKIMRKLIRQFVLNYDEWAGLMMVSEKSRAILNRFKDRPYRIGTYRVDTVFDQTYQQKIIEITCRFALNGVFMGGLADHKTQQYCASASPEIERHDRYASFINYLDERLSNYQKVIVLHTINDRNSSDHYQAIFERTGLEVVKIAVDEIPARIDEISDGLIISELTLEELENLSEATWLAMEKLEIFNDPRTVILVHDKRFFDVIGNAKFRASVLSEAEISLLDDFYVPTYQYHSDCSYWKAAKVDKDNWIIKHRALGKSIDIFAGEVMDQADWQALFERPDRNDLVLQRWIKQAQVKGTVKGIFQQDYATLTQLFIDDYFFGPGIVRTSSHPVLNKTDDRKSFTLILR